MRLHSETAIARAVFEMEPVPGAECYRVDPEQEQNDGEVHPGLPCTILLVPYPEYVLFSGLELSRRLERAEGHACVQYAEAHRRLFPASGAEWMECAGAQVVFDGVDSPITQSFGLGIFETLTAGALDEIERFFHDRGAPVLHEVSFLAGVPAMDLLCARNYRPIEISNVVYQRLTRPAGEDEPDITVRVIGPEDAPVWGDIGAQAWAHEHPEFMDFLLEAGAICTEREDSVCFLGEVGGKPGAASLLCLHKGVALFGGSSTIPGLRRHGLHGVLLRERMRYAFDHGCDLAMMAAEAGSNSQRNAEREGFRVAYTRTKWKLSA